MARVTVDRSVQTDLYIWHHELTQCLTESLILSVADFRSATVSILWRVDIYSVAVKKTFSAFSIVERRLSHSEKTHFPNRYKLNFSPRHFAVDVIELRQLVPRPLDKILVLKNSKQAFSFLQRARFRKKLLKLNIRVMAVQKRSWKTLTLLNICVAFLTAPSRGSYGKSIRYCFILNTIGFLPSSQS